MLYYKVGNVNNKEFERANSVNVVSNLTDSYRRISSQDHLGLNLNTYLI